jgi:hypothetical protein
MMDDESAKQKEIEDEESIEKVAQSYATSHPSHSSRASRMLPVTRGWYIKT